jgi:hypothetical protein
MECRRQLDRIPRLLYFLRYGLSNGPVRSLLRKTNPCRFGACTPFDLPEVTQITDARSRAEQNQGCMISRLPMRRMLSLTLMLAVGLWAEAGLGQCSDAAKGSSCPMSQAQQTRSHCELQGSSPLPCHHEQVNVMPCCPAHVMGLSLQRGDPSNCCVTGTPPARPLAFLVVSGKPQMKKLIANGPGAGIASFARLLSSQATKSVAPSQFAPAVFDKKSDLRI